MIHQQAITGQETLPDIVQSPRQALHEFYRAFNTGDISLMSANWENSEEVSMSNPLGELRRGWQNIRSVYEGIFQGTARVLVEFHDYSLHVTGQMFCAVGRERGYFQTAQTKVELAIRTSRIYRLNGDRWRQLHHHGSIDIPALLARYQQAVLGEARR